MVVFIRNLRRHLKAGRIFLEFSVSDAVRQTNFQRTRCSFERF